MIKKNWKYNMRHALTILLFSCAFLSCGSKKSSAIIPQDKMEKVLWDLAQSSEFLNGFVYYRYPQLNQAAINNQLLDSIFKIHKISRAQFTKSMEYYSNNPKKLTAVLDSAINTQKRLSGDTTTSESRPLVEAPQNLQ